jgi:serine/threonine-protein kinase
LGTNVLNSIELPERYEVVRHVANGGMASVWCADDLVLGRRVAIKVLAEQFQHDEAAIRRFKREARTQARLATHPHIVNVYDVGEVGGRAFIVMEHLAGGTVADALRVGAVGHGDALRWLEEAAAALDHAHREGVIHRDIKPGNFLLGRDRVLYVGDFGIARVATEDTITSSEQLIGTAAYIAPEQVLGRPATEASDRYSFGVAAFELLVGERPFRAEHFAAQARQHIEEEPPPASARNASLPPALDAILSTGLAKRPEDRWPTATEFVGRIEEAFRSPRTRALRRPAAGPIGDRGWTPIVAGASSNRSRWRGTAVGALAGAALAAAAVAVASNGGGTPPRPAAHATKPAPKVAAKTPSRRKPTPRTTTTAQQVAAPVQSTPATDAASLEARGHQLMMSGDYNAAIPVLRSAVAAATPGSLTYAYALYDLGRSLRLAGDPQAAVPVLQRRLQIPNQTGVVRHELALASTTGFGSGGAAPGDGKKHNGNHGGGGGD